MKTVEEIKAEIERRIEEYRAIYAPLTLPDNVLLSLLAWIEENNIKKEAFPCPACYGRGFMPTGYIAETQHGTSALNTMMQICLVCNGSGTAQIF